MSPLLPPLLLALVFLPAAEEGAGADSLIAPEFELTDTFGAPIRLSELRGRVVALLFWARFCTSCEEDLRAFEGLRRQFPNDDLVVLGLGYASGARREIAEFAAGLGLSYPMLLCTEMVRNQYEVAVFPTTLILDREGRIHTRRTGALVASYWQSVLAELIDG